MQDDGQTDKKVKEEINIDNELSSILVLEHTISGINIDSDKKLTAHGMGDGDIEGLSTHPVQSGILADAERLCQLNRELADLRNHLSEDDNQDSDDELKKYQEIDKKANSLALSISVRKARTIDELTLMLAALDLHFKHRVLDEVWFEGPLQSVFSQVRAALLRVDGDTPLLECTWRT